MQREDYISMNVVHACVVYFDQLLCAVRTQKLVGTFFQPLFNVFCSFQSFFSVIYIINPNQSNVAEPMSETLNSIESQGIRGDSIEHQKIERRSTKPLYRAYFGRPMDEALKN